MNSRKYLFTLILFWGYILPGSSQIKNLVMEGGGIRGIAYCGAVEVLEEENLLLEIENVAGTSVGGITAALLCVGYTSKELEEELKSIKFQDFNDGRGIFVGGISRTIKKFGWYRGVEITKWMNALLQEKTGIENLTFEDLNRLQKEGKPYKNLYVTATNLSLQNFQVLSYETFPQMRIADAVRISASIPIYYKAIFMDELGNVYEKPPKNIPTWVMADGGFFSNYPIHIFDEKYAQDETLGLRLDSEEQIVYDKSQNNELAPHNIENFRDYISAFYNLVIEKLNRNSLTEQDWKRTISISTCGIGPKIKKLSEEDVQKLIESGRSATCDYFIK